MGAPKELLCPEVPGEKFFLCGERACAAMASANVARHGSRSRSATFSAGGASAYRRTARVGAVERAAEIRVGDARLSAARASAHHSGGDDCDVRRTSTRRGAQSPRRAFGLARAP